MRDKKKFTIGFYTFPVLILYYYYTTYNILWHIEVHRELVGQTPDRDPHESLELSSAGGIIRNNINNKRRKRIQTLDTRRRDTPLSSLQDAYYTVSSNDVTLGSMNYDITHGNPLKGFAVNPDTTERYAGEYRTVHSLEAYYIGFDSIVIGPNQYNWTYFEIKLNETARNNAHAIPRFIIQYQDQPLMLPIYLLETIQLIQYDEFISPNYTDPIFLQAIQDFIYEFGNKYDGDRRIGFIQMGLLGFWGEWHDKEYEFLPDEVRNLVIQWYTDSFTITPLQVRQPMVTAYEANVGYHDDSFTYATLDGDANGGIEKRLYFWPRVEELNQTDFWKRAPMGGEIRPDNKEDIFDLDYPAGTENRQDFVLCVNVTHTTYMKHSWFFKTEDEILRQEMNAAIQASARMGYSFYIAEVSVAKSRMENVLVSSTSRAAPKTELVDIVVAVEQIGIAPFYYPLNLVLNCVGLSSPLQLSGVEILVEQFQKEYFVFEGIPATSTCLDEITISLDSFIIYPGNPIRFAQGSNGFISLSLPVPPIDETATPAQTEEPIVLDIQSVPPNNGSQIFETQPPFVNETQPPLVNETKPPLVNETNSPKSSAFDTRIHSIVVAYLLFSGMVLLTGMCV